LFIVTTVGLKVLMTGDPTQRIHPICQAILDVRRKDHQQREIETVEPNLERSENRDDISEPKTKEGLMWNDGNNHSPRLLTGRVFK